MTDRPNSIARFAGAKEVHLAGILVVLVLLVTTQLAATAGAAESTDPTSSLPAEPAFVTDLNADGSARVTLVTTFDLVTDSERQAFEKLRANESARDQQMGQFASRMRAIATRAETETDRDMAIRDPAMTFATENDTGIVSLSVTWDGLAKEAGDRLSLREPFASGFDIDRPFWILGPDGYELETAIPTPTTQHPNSVRWSETTQFEGFETVFAPAESGAGTEADRGTSGVGAPDLGLSVGAIAVLFAFALLAWRHRE